MVGVDLATRSPASTSSIACDVADEDAVTAMYDRAMAEFGHLDVLFNNAGISPDDDVSVLDTSLEAWQRVQDVNLQARSSSAASTASRSCSRTAAGRSSTPPRSWP